MQLSYHTGRSQPLSDIVGNAEATFYLISNNTHDVHVSVMTSRGLTHVDKVKLGPTPYKIPYAAPWGRDWSVLQLQAAEPKPGDAEPYEVTLVVERS
jgi:hypothetical protein